MNKSVIKNFAVTARIKLMEAIEQKAYELGITNKEIKEPEVYKEGFRVNDKFFKKYQIKQRGKLIQKINEQGFEQVIEEVAYTWFNRLIAIRFMEVNEYLPTGVRVLSSIDIEKREPDAVSNVLTIADDLELDLDIVYRLQDENNSEELFKYILVKQCNKLGEIMPFMFEKIEDYTELLLPDNLLTEGSVLRDLVSMIEEKDWKEQVEIIGWLYQEYISEKKAEVDAGVKKGNKVKKEQLPAKTQIFTPKWIVKYMVENTLGRLWIESHPNEELKQQWKYYLEESEQEFEVQEQLEKLKNRDLNLEDIKVLDPCMGSGHILVYAFDVLYSIYQSAGYSEREIPQLILENNLYGLDIDDRAAQLAYFALMMKARSFDRRIFRRQIELNVCAIQESNTIPKDAVNYLLNDLELEIDKAIQRETLSNLIKKFIDAKEYGATLTVDDVDLEILENILEILKQNEDIENIFYLQYRDILLEKLPLLIKQGKILQQNYHVVITNPPYMGSSDMDDKLLTYVNENYPETKKDLSTVFMEKASKLLKANGYYAMINIPTWMNLSSYDDFRKKLFKEEQIISLIHLGRGVFGSDFGTVSFVFRKSFIPSYNSTFKKLFEKKSEVESNESKRKKFFIEDNKYINKQDNFYAIENVPVAYNASDSIITIYRNEKKIGEIAQPRQGLATGSNDTFVRNWFEVDINKIGFNFKNRETAKISSFKWFPYNKGGEFRKYYGNNYYVVDWENDGERIRNFKNEKGKIRSRPQNMNYYFKEAVTWSKVTIGGFSTRFVPEGFIFDVAGCSIFAEEDQRLFLLGLTNSKITPEILSFLSPTVNYEVGHISNIPVKFESIEIVDKLVQENIYISKKNWDSYEISWDFKKHPLLILKTESSLLKDSFEKWVEVTEKQSAILKENEETLNSIFLEIYGLQKELSPEVSENDITIVKSNLEKDIKSFISYAIGCVFGRYSLDLEGLIFAGGAFNKNKYTKFNVDNDNIIPITDEAYFDDDIVSRFIDFINVAFGQETLEENLDFIANALTKKANETSRQCIRRYFVKEFYNDHVQRYTVNNQKRPIYWLFDSGKNDGFKALIYMHRYDFGTVASLRTDYLHTLQRKYEAEMSRLDLLLESDVSVQEKTSSKKQKEKIKKQLIECQQYDQVIAHVANQKIELDLDDGFKVNYSKFQNIEVPQGEGKKPIKSNLLTKI